MAIPNMAMIPSGYKPTKLYSVLPTPSLGSEEITNGDFSTDSGWIKGTGWSISGGKANSDGTINQNITQSNVFTIGKSYKVDFTISDVVGSLDARIWMATGGGKINVNANGEYTTYWEADGTGLAITSLSGNAATYSIDNVSVKEVLVSDADFDVSRASSATRVNAKGLIETPEFIVSDELITNGDFSNGSADWDLSGGSWTIVSGVATFDGLNNAKRIFQSVGFVQNKNYKISFDVTQTDDDFISLFFGQNATQLIGTKNYKVGSYELYAEASVTTENLSIYAYNTTYGGGSVDNISVVQVEREDIPRLDYTDGGCPVLLTEPQSTNLIAHSEDFSASSWDKLNSGTADVPVVTSSYAISPDGTQNASRVVFNLNGGTSSNDYSRITSVANTTTSPTLSCYLKSNTSESYELNFSYSGDSINPIIVTPNEWTRVEYQASTSGVFRFRLELRGSFVNDDFADISIWGAQLEELSYATSYIPTYGAISTRASETITNATPEINSAEGVLYFEGSLLANSTTFKVISLSDGSIDDIVAFVYRNVDNELSSIIKSGGSTSLSKTITLADSTENIKVAISYKLNEFKFYLNGILMHTDTNGATPIGMNVLNLSDGNGASNKFFGNTKSLQVFNTALSDSELQTLTTI